MCFKMTTKTQRNMTQSKINEMIVTKKQTQKTQKKLHIVMCFKMTTITSRHITRDNINQLENDNRNKKTRIQRKID